MRRESPLRKLLDGLGRAPHDYRPTTTVFPELNIDRLAADMELAKVGAERGRAKLPPAGTTDLDQIELRITERIASEQHKSYGTLEDELRTYSERIASLDFDGRFSAIRQAAPEAVADFRAEAAKGQDELFALRRHLIDVERERASFQRRHKLERPPRSPSGATTFLKIAFLFLLWILETYTNGSFLAKGNELGILGGTTEAAGFAALNIGGSLLLALVGVRQLNHRSIIAKFLGMVALAAFIAMALALNLALAHYREVSGTLIETAGTEVIRRLREHPLELVDINTWIFFGLGLLFSILAFIDGFLLTDPYPGYGAVGRRLQESHYAYINRKSALIDELTGIRTEYAAQLEEINRDLSLRRGEYDALLASRARIVGLFVQHQNHLERAANLLLTTYREANASVRAEAPPPSFGRPFVLPRIEVATNVLDPAQQEDLRESFRRTRELLETEVKEVHADYQRTLELYRQIDDMIIEPSHGTSAT